MNEPKVVKVSLEEIVKMYLDALEEKEPVEEADCLASEDPES